MSAALSRLPAEVVSQARFAGADGASAVAGEGVPAWLAPAIGGVGALVAAAAAWMWIDARADRVQSVPVAAQTEAANNATVGSTVALPSTVPVPAPEPASAPITAPTTAPAPACPGRVAVQFAFDSAVPVAPLPEELVPLIALTGGHPEARILVQGYADPVGTDQYNLLLSWRRARAVAGILERLGVPAAQMSVAAAGADSSTQVDAGGPRRVEVLAVGVPGCTAGR